MSLIELSSVLDELDSHPGASDLHLKVGTTPHVRVDGQLRAVPSLPVLDGDTVMSFIRELIGDSNVEGFLAAREADCAYTWEGKRYRVNCFVTRTAPGVVIRKVLAEPPLLTDLGLPSAVQLMAEQQRGLVLVTGPTGSGKTTTTAAIINHINQTRRCHIVTVEDPIEVLHDSHMALVDQREVGEDTDGFAVALRQVARQDPDVIFIGEIRDLDTVTAALQAAETGHLVISTLHTTDATETVNRIVDFYPPHQQMQARVALAHSLRGVVSQRLLPRATGRGRVAALEILVVDDRTRSFLLDQDSLGQLPDAIADGGYYGMQTFDGHLLKMFEEGTITFADALSAATSGTNLKAAARHAGLVPQLRT